jgi:hypothetical protein
MIRRRVKGEERERGRGIIIYQLMEALCAYEKKKKSKREA